MNIIQEIKNEQKKETKLKGGEFVFSPRKQIQFIQMSLEINITNRKELDIYMNVQRQRLLKIMEVCGIPMTPKQLSLKLDISPSSVTYHLKKLQSLGLVELDHTEMIHGIEAKFYKKLPVIVNLKGDLKDDLSEEKMVLAEYEMNYIWTGFKKYISKISTDTTEEFRTKGDFINGTFYLTDEEAKQLKDLIQKFHESHITPTADAKPWEIALVAFPEEI